MCMMSLQLPGSEILSDEAIYNSWSNNKDGAGFMFCKEGQLCIEKPFFKLSAFKRAYKAAFAQYGAISPFVCHFRWSTHGKNTDDNTHPHVLADGMVGLAHNGILHHFDPPAGFYCSDTAWFCNTVLAGRHQDQLMNKDFGEWLEWLIGFGNKFLLLCGDGRYSIIGEDQGVWDDGVWYSNHGYCTPPKLVKSSLFDSAPVNGYKPLDYYDDESREALEEWEREVMEMDNKLDDICNSDDRRVG